MPDDGRRPQRSSWTNSKPSPIEKPLPIDGWEPALFDEIHVGDLVSIKLMAPFDAGDGTPRMSHVPGRPSFAMRAGLSLVARVVGEDLDNDGALLLERTRWSHNPDPRVIQPAVVMSLSRRDLDRRGAWAYRHRNEGPADRSGRTGTKLLHDRLLRAAGGDANDEIVVDRVAGCLGPETTAGAKPGLVERIRAGMMLRGEAAFSEIVYAQLLAMPPIVRPQPRSEVRTKPERKPVGAAVAIDADTKDQRSRLGPYAGVDAVLSLRFETRAIWGVLKAVLGVSETGCAIALDLYAEALTSGRWTSYSRSKRHYARLAGARAKWQARDGLYSEARVVGAVDDLEARGWIDNAKAMPGALGWQSRMRAKPALVDAIRGLVRSNRMTLTAYQPSSPLVLRDAEGMPMPFKATAETRRMERNVERLNEGFRAIRVEGAFPSCAMRICNESLERGGRFYLEGGSIQVMPEEERLRVTWDGERSGEVDYKTMHLGMLYSDAGLVPPTDSYAIDGYPRDLVKVAVLAVINAPTYGSALGAIAYDRHIAGVEMPGSDAAFIVAARLMGDLKAMHRPIASSFHSGAGAFLMRREADIFEDVMLTMRKRGEVVLPIHDSGLCRLGAVSSLEEVMVQAAEKAGLKSVRIETTVAANDDVEIVDRERTA